MAKAVGCADPFSEPLPLYLRGRVGSSPVVRTKKPVRILTGFFILSGINLKTLYLSRYDGGRLSMNKK